MEQESSKRNQAQNELKNRMQEVDRLRCTEKQLKQEINTALESKRSLEFQLVQLTKYVDFTAAAWKSKAMLLYISSISFSAHWQLKAIPRRILNKCKSILSRISRAFAFVNKQHYCLPFPLVHFGKSYFEVKCNIVALKVGCILYGHFGDISTFHTSVVLQGRAFDYKEIQLKDST